MCISFSDVITHAFTCFGYAFGFTFNSTTQLDLPAIFVCQLNQIAVVCLIEQHLKIFESTALFQIVFAPETLVLLLQRGKRFLNSMRCLEHWAVVSN